MPANMRKPKSSNEIKNPNNNNNNDEIYEDNTLHRNLKKNTRQSQMKSSNLVRRRQVHVKCEHRRRKEIQEALEMLEAELPRNQNQKPRSKGSIIEDSANMIKDLTFKLDRLLNENQNLLNRVQVKDLTK